MHHTALRGLIRAAAVCLILPAVAAAEAPWQTEQVDPGVYGPASDEITPQEAEALLLELLNEERAGHGCAALAPDETAGELAAARAAEIEASGVASHYDAAGRKVEQRFNMLGRTDHATENVSLYFVDTEVHLTPQVVRRVHAHWLDSPGHRANMLDPAHTGLGAAFRVDYDAESGTSTISAAAIFVNSYGEHSSLAGVFPGAGATLSGVLHPGEARLVAVTLAREDIDLAGAGAAEGYSQPAPSIAYVQPGSSYGPAERPPYTIHGLSVDDRTYSLWLYIPGHWTACRIYVCALAETPDGRRFRIMTQVIEAP